MPRTWTPIDRDPRWDREGYYDEVKAKLDGLMLWWSQLHDSAEREGWDRQRALEEGGWDGEDYPRASWFAGGESDPEYIAEVKAIEDADRARKEARAARDEMQRSQVEFIEAQLADAGARPMRAYEHWNEDEAFMAYSERDR